MSERYEMWMSSVPRAKIRVICRDGEWDALPETVRHRGPWTGDRRGEIMRLKPELRLALARQGYAVIEDAGAIWTPEVGP